MVPAQNGLICQISSVIPPRPPKIGSLLNRNHHALTRSELIFGGCGGNELHTVSGINVEFGLGPSCKTVISIARVLPMVKFMILEIDPTEAIPLDPRRQAKLHHSCVLGQPEAFIAAHETARGMRSLVEVANFGQKNHSERYVTIS